MSHVYHDGHRELQDRFDTRRLADRLEAVKVHDRLTPEDQAFIQGLDLLFLATSDHNGQPTCSYKGGERGFVRVIDDRTFIFPSYDGNGMFLSLGNVRLNPKVGIMFLDIEQGRRLRVHGEATLYTSAEVLRQYPEAQALVRVTVQQVFPNCPRYVHRYIPAERSEFVPRAGRPTPVPAWKRSEWARDVLPANDPARPALEP